MALAVSSDQLLKTLSLGLISDPLNFMLYFTNQYVIPFTLGLKNYQPSQVVVVHKFSASTQEAEAGVSLRLRTAWPAE